MPAKPTKDDVYIDSNGCLTERIRLGGQEVVVHYDDIPESDITNIDGIRVTTPIRTVIDIAPDVRPRELARIIRDCLDRRLFTIEEALTRLDQPDMAARKGAHLVRAALATGRPNRRT
jgi:hypothetical protein